MSKSDGKKRKDSDPDLSSAGKILGSKGGRLGGPARAAALSAAERSAIAKQGGLARAAKAKSVKAKLKKPKKKKGS